MAEEASSSKAAREAPPAQTVKNYNTTIHAAVYYHGDYGTTHVADCQMTIGGSHHTEHRGLTVNAGVFNQSGQATIHVADSSIAIGGSHVTEHRGYFVLENGMFGVYKNRFLCKRSNVYLGKQISEDSGSTQTLAIKLQQKNQESLREALVLAKLGNHVNVVPIIHIGIHHADPLDYIYIAMEHRLTKTVRNMLEEFKLRKPFSEFIAWSLAEQLMRAVEFLHSRNIIHCDLKTDNILASDNWGLFKVTGFGSSKEASDDSATIQTSATTDSEGYRSPETYNLNAKITTEADIFSAGIIIAEIMANGKHPFGDDPDLWRYNIKSKMNLNLSHIHAVNKDQVIGLIEQMLEMDPEERPVAEIVFKYVSLYFELFKLNQKTGRAGRSLAATSKEGRIVDVFQDEIIEKLPFSEFRKFARSSYGLCLDEPDLENIAEKHENDVEEQKLQMLFQWKINNGNEASVSMICSLLQRYLNRDNQKAETRRGQSKLKRPAKEGNSASPQKSSGFEDAAGTSNSGARESISAVMYYKNCIIHSTCVADSELKSGGTHNYSRLSSKAVQQKTTRRNRKKSTILTETPEKDAAEQKYKEKMIKKHKLMSKKCQKKGDISTKKKTNPKIKVRKKLVLEESDSESDKDEMVSLSTSSLSDIDEISSVEGELESLDIAYAIEDFVLVKFKGKKSVAHYIGQIKNITEERYTTSFLRRSNMNRTDIMSFTFPEENDDAEHKIDDIIMKLPKPKQYGKTKRCSEKYVFHVDLATYQPM